MNYHLIVGFGKWSKKNLRYLKSKKKISNIIIKTRDKYIYPNKDEIEGLKINRILKKTKTVHICTPVKNHYESLKKFKFYKKIIVEKPIVENKAQLNKIKKLYKNKFFIVNYIDIFNPLMNKIRLSLKKKNFYKIKINYSKKHIFYKRKNEFLDEWLDHPLSLILFLFKEFGRLELVSATVNRRNNLYNQSVAIKYFYPNFKIYINLNISKKVERNFQIYDDKTYTTFHFYKNSIYKKNKKIFQSKKNSFDLFYKMINLGIKNSSQNFKFHEKIFNEKRKIIKKVKKNI